MSVDLVHPAVEKVTLVFEGVGAGKIRVNSSSFDHPLTILDDQANRNRGDREEGADDALGLLAEPRSEWTGRGGLRTGDEVTAFQL
jgi:hypothetical protein